MSDKKRFAHFASNEEDLLISLVAKYKDIIECKKSGATTWKQKEDTWAKIQEEFNAASGNFRPAKNLKDKYLNLKKKTKKNFSLNKQLIKKTGGGPPEMVPITNAEQTIKELLDEQITGVLNVYDSDSILQENTADEQLEHNWDPPSPVISSAIETEKMLAHISNAGEILLKSSNNKIVDSEATSLPERNNYKRTWETYCPADIKRTPSKKLKTVVERRAKVDKKYVNLNYQLVQEKISFVKLQREKFLEEHELRIKLLKKQIENEELKNKSFS